MVDDEMSPLLGVLREIREEIRGTNERLDRTNERLDRTSDRMEAHAERLDGRIDRLADTMHQGHVRLATEVVAMAQAVGEVRDLLRDRLDDRGRIDDHERRLRHLEHKVG